MKYWSMRFWYPKLKKYTPPSAQVIIPKELQEFIITHHNPMLVPTQEFCDELEVYLRDNHRGFYREFYHAKTSLNVSDVFIRTDYASPKDVWEKESFDLKPYVRTAGQAVAYIISSERVSYFHELEHEKIGRIWLRKPMNFLSELRVFILNSEVFLISQYDYTKYDSFLDKNKGEVILKTLDLLKQIWWADLGFPGNIVVDVGLVLDETSFRCVIIEINKFVADDMSVDSCLFSWREIINHKTDKKVVFRWISSEEY